jgi:hypothetical protein
MPIGSFDLSDFATSIAGTALPITVSLYDPASEGDSPFTVLPNVRCLRVDYREGPEPGTAQFQYLTDDSLAANLGWPCRFEQLWPIDASGSYVVQVDDRLVVHTYDPSGNPIALFDGFAQIPQVDVAPQSQAITFVAVSVSVRLWDTPITKRVQRDGDDALQTDGSSDVLVQLPTRFNPADHTVGARGGYLGNMSDITTEDAGTGLTYKVFVDPLLNERNPDPTDFWWVSDALKYLFAIYPSPETDEGDPYVQYPTFDSLDAVLSTLDPSDDGPINAGTVVSSDLKIRDYDATNKTVPEAIAEILSYAGFVMNFLTDGDEDGIPTTTLLIQRRDAFASGAPRSIYLAPDGSASLDLAANNATAFHLARDTNQVVNQWLVESKPIQAEITVILAPGFTPVSGDNSAANVTKWYKSNLAKASGSDRRKYRWYIADECGDGHWNAQTSTFNTTALDLSGIVPSEIGDNPPQVKRYRPGSKTLISKDADGNPLKHVLEVIPFSPNRDPILATAQLSADKGQFQSLPGFVVSSGYQLLDDRLGIEVTADDPENWSTGNPKWPTIMGVTSQSDPIDNATIVDNFTLRLTTVIELDQQITAFAKKRVASPTGFARQRNIDAKEHFQFCFVTPYTMYFTQDGGNGTDPLIVRDDTQAAITHAAQLRAVHEFPTLAGSVTIPYITDYYQIGDMVNLVQGRNANLQINVGESTGEDPTYPWVTAFSWTFEHDRQQTVLQLSDRRAEVQGL